MQRAYLGIDPGTKGAACLLTCDRIWFHDFDTVSKAADVLKIWVAECSIHACVERLSHQPFKGPLATFKLAQNYGQWEALLVANYIAYDLVAPQTWQAAMIPSGMKKVIKSTKERSIKTAQQFYPAIKNKLYLSKHHNRAEALLLAT